VAGGFGPLDEGIGGKAQGLAEQKVGHAAPFGLDLVPARRHGAPLSRSRLRLTTSWRAPDRVAVPSEGDGDERAEKRGRREARPTWPRLDPDAAEAPNNWIDAHRERILDAVEARDAATVAAELEPLHAADIADLLEQISGQQRRALLSLYAVEIDGEILSELDESIREEVIEALPREVLAEAVRELETDDVVDLLEDLEDSEQAFILQSLESDDRAAVESAMGWPEYSAGRLMQSETVTVPRSTGRWARPSTICAPSNGCPTSSITSSSSMPATGPPAT
jgi:hypothetical protein